MIFLVLTAFGIALICRPQLYYQLTESWKHDGGSEPSDRYIKSTRIGGVICALAGIGCMIAVFIAQA